MSASASDFIIIFSIQSCENNHIFQGNIIEINSDVKSNKKIEDFLKPYKKKIDIQMDSVLAYSPTDYDKKKGIVTNFC